MWRNLTRRRRPRLGSVSRPKRVGKGRFVEADIVKVSEQRAERREQCWLVEQTTNGRLGPNETKHETPNGTPVLDGSSVGQHSEERRVVLQVKGSVRVK
jgi:hypothetical protein